MLEKNTKVGINYYHQTTNYKNEQVFWYEITN